MSGRGRRRLGFVRTGRSGIEARWRETRGFAACFLRPLRKGKGAAGVIFVGFLLLGFAVGFFTGNLVFGLFGGLGVGFIAMGIARAITGEW